MPRPGGSQHILRVWAGKARDLMTTVLRTGQR